MNRLSQHFAAIAGPQPPASNPADVPQPGPRRGHDHFAVGIFDPRKYRKAWTARSDEDAPKTLKYEDVDFRERYCPNSIADALRRVKAFNAPRFADRATVSEWALIAWVEGAYESIKMPYARSVSPLAYFTQEALTPPAWRPVGLLDTPLSLWGDEQCALAKHAHDTLEEAVTVAAVTNRKFRPGKRKKSGWPQRWAMVLAFEADPLNSFDALNYSGRAGTMTVTENRRFHLVGPTWPLAPETLAVVKGGADHD